MDTDLFYVLAVLLLLSLIMLIVGGASPRVTHRRRPGASVEQQRRDIREFQRRYPRRYQ